MTPMFKENTEKDSVDTLERKMVRTLALHRELKKILAAEYEACENAKHNDLVKLTLRKNNCVNRFENLVRAINDQLDRMADGDLPDTCPRTLANRVRHLPGLATEAAAVLLPLARELETEHRALVRAARKNVLLLKGTMDRFWAVSQYTENRITENKYTENRTAGTTGADIRYLRRPAETGCSV